MGAEHLSTSLLSESVILISCDVASFWCARRPEALVRKAQDSQATLASRAECSEGDTQTVRVMRACTDTTKTE